MQGQLGRGAGGGQRCRVLADRHVAAPAVYPDKIRSRIGPIMLTVGLCWRQPRPFADQNSKAYPVRMAVQPKSPLRGSDYQGLLNTWKLQAWSMQCATTQQASGLGLTTHNHIDRPVAQLTRILATSTQLLIEWDLFSQPTHHLANFIQTVSDQHIPFAVLYLSPPMRQWLPSTPSTLTTSVFSKDRLNQYGTIGNHMIHTSVTSAGPTHHHFISETNPQYNHHSDQSLLMLHSADSSATLHWQIPCSTRPFT
jgi:hypothetical protein